MALSEHDRALGMDRPISRRDFLNGVALTVTAAAMSGLPQGAMGANPATDPAPATGLAVGIMSSERDGNLAAA
jgi:spermidine dehydrogenase